MTLILFTPKSESRAVKELHDYMYHTDQGNHTFVELYEEIDREFLALQNDMESVEEQVEIAEETIDELTGGLDDLLKNLSGMKKAEIRAELERLRFI
jgi:uncharacterized protein with von Willebrand factor type A (vWA) domain